MESDAQERVQGPLRTIARASTASKSSWERAQAESRVREEQEKAKVGARVAQKNEHQKQREVLTEEAKHKAAASRVPLPPPPVETLGAQRSAQSSVAAKKFRAVRHTVGASVRFTQAQGFSQQQDFTPPVNVHREEREATRRYLQQEEPLSAAERRLQDVQAPSIFVAGAAALAIQRILRGKIDRRRTADKASGGLRFEGARPFEQQTSFRTFQGGAWHVESTIEVPTVPAQRDVGSPTVTVTPFTQPSIAVDDSEASAALRKVLDYGTPSAAPAVVTAEGASGRSDSNYGKPVPASAGVAPAALGGASTGSRPPMGGLASSGLKYDQASGMWLPPGKSAPPPPTPGKSALPPPKSPARKPAGPGLGGLASSGLKYDLASGMWLPPGKSAPPPRTAGKSAGLGGLASSGLKYDPASGMWLPPGKAAPTPPPGAASSSRPAAPQRGLSSSGFAYDAQSGMWLPKHKLPS